MSEEIKWRTLKDGESLAILEEHLENENNDILGFRNHRGHRLKNNTFRFTVNLISLDFLIGLMEDEAIKNVYFSPSVPPPGGAVDSISMRYKVYVEYHEIEDTE